MCYIVKVRILNFISPPQKKRKKKNRLYCSSSLDVTWNDVDSKVSKIDFYFIFRGFNIYLTALSSNFAYSCLIALD